MAVRKTVTDEVTVPGAVSEWLDRVDAAFDRAGFRSIECDETLRQVTGRYRKPTTSGRLTVTVHPAGSGARLSMSATADVDNIYALFGGSPGRKIITRFKRALSATPPG